MEPFDIPITGQEVEQFIRELFESFVDGPLSTPEQKRSAASSIALAVVETHSNGLHMAYNTVRNQRVVKGLPLGS